MKKLSLGLVAIGIVGGCSVLPKCEKTEAPEVIKINCDHGWHGHLQGVATDGESVYWSWTTAIVKTDFMGNVLKEVEVPSHHGDLCVYDGKVYVAVNLGRFNRPSGKEAKSEVRAYDVNTLEHRGTWKVPELIYGAGGMTHYRDCFYVIGGLPDGMDGNAVYEYDHEFKFLRKIPLNIGWTQLGIQTVDATENGVFRFGIYGKILGRTDKGTKAEPAYAMVGGFGDFDRRERIRRVDLSGAAIGVLRIGDYDYCAAHYKIEKDLPDWNATWTGLIHRVREFKNLER